MPGDDTPTETVLEAKQFLSSVGKDDLADRFDEELDSRAEAAERVVRMKELAARAEEAGLDDDPAVAALRDRAQAIQTDADLGPEPHAAERLAEDFGLDEDAVADLPEDVREDLRADLEAVGELERGEARGVAKHELRRRRDHMSDLLDDVAVEAADLVAATAPAPQAELSAALAAADKDIDDSGSERVRAARLEDKKADLEKEIDDAESALLELTLRDRLADVETTLSDLEEA